MEKLWIGCAAENFRRGRPPGAKPEVIVIHIIVGSLNSADNTFRQPNLTPRRSAHYGVGKTGIVHQYVREEDTAFHAGIVNLPQAPIVVSRPGVNPNFYSIGIEHDGIPDDPWPEAQIATSAALVAEVAARHGIPLDRRHVIMHREIRASKTCPGFGIDVDALVKRAAALGGGAAAAGAASVTPSVALFPLDIRVLRAVHVRQGRPAVDAPSLAVLPGGSTIHVGSIVDSGRPIEGNPWWCELAQPTTYCWSGATDVFARVPYPEKTP